MEFVAGPKPAADPCEKKARIDPKALYGLTIEERVAAALAHEQPPQPVLDKWARGRWWYVNTLFVSFVAVGLAFVPSIVKWLQTGVWHMNPIYSFTNPFQRLVGAHAISGLLLLALFFVQVFAGVTGSPDSRRRVYHRRIGYFIIAPLMFITLGIATATEVMANLCCQEFGFETTLIATVILICFTLGLRAARQKRIPEHKDWMMWTVLLTSEVGFARIGMYIAQPFYKCDTFMSDWPFVSSIWITNTAAFICLKSVGRFGWKYKSNLFIWFLQAAVGGYSLVSAIMFECPLIATNVTNVSVA